MWLEPVSDGKEIVTLMCGNKTKTSVCAESLVFTCVRVWCSPVVDEASQFIMSTWDGLVRDVTISQWGWMRRKLVVFLLFCIDIWIMDSVLKQCFQNISDCFLDNSNCESVLNSGKFIQWLPTHQRSSLLW